MMNEVVQYLTAIQLANYAGVILENGFDELDALYDISIPEL